jgi:hypothetical protein
MENAMAGTRQNGLIFLPGNVVTKEKTRKQGHALYLLCLFLPAILIILGFVDEALNR